MPEIITGNTKIELWNHRRVNVYGKEHDLLMKNPFTKQKVQKYGELSPLPVGSAANIKVPQKYSSHLKEYKFEPENSDYLGSYHITLTLPFRPKTTNKRFIENHQN